MKKILLSIVILFNFSFAGETGYIWLANVNQFFDFINMLDKNNYNQLSFSDEMKVNSIIIIHKNNKIYFSIEDLNKINKSYIELIKEEKCSLLKFGYVNFLYDLFKNDCSLVNVEKKLNIKENNNYKITNYDSKYKILDFVVFFNSAYLFVEEI